MTSIALAYGAATTAPSNTHVPSICTDSTHQHTGGRHTKARGEAVRRQRAKARAAGHEQYALVGSIIEVRTRYGRPSLETETSTRAIQRALGKAPGTVRAAGVHQWHDVLRTHPKVAKMRAHGRENLLCVAQMISDVAHETKMTSVPVWSRIADKLGISRSTVRGHFKTLRSLGLLVTVATGRRARDAVRWGSQRGVERPVNEAGVYLLTVPREAVSEGAEGGKLPTSTRRVVPSAYEDSFPSHAGAHSREEETSTEDKGGSCRGRLRSFERFSTYPLHQAPGSGHRWQRQAAARVADEHMSLSYLSDRANARLFRPYFEAGWSPYDVLEALDHTPEGRRHAGYPLPEVLISSGPVGHRLRIEGLTRYRLALWTDSEGVPLPSADAAAQVRAARKRQEAVSETRKARESLQAAASDEQRQKRRRGWAMVRAALRGETISPITTTEGESTP